MLKLNLFPKNLWVFVVYKWFDFFNLIAKQTNQLWASHQVYASQNLFLCLPYRLLRMSKYSKYHTFAITSW